MNSKESSKVRRLARVVSRANEVFDDAASAVSWLESPNAALRGNVPLRLLDTNIGGKFWYNFERIENIIAHCLNEGHDKGILCCFFRFNFVFHLIDTVSKEFDLIFKFHIVLVKVKPNISKVCYYNRNKKVKNNPAE